MSDSEMRLYGFILEKLQELGWDKRSPHNGGQVYTQSELRNNPDLRQALGDSTPENVVYLSNGEYWVIEAKRDPGDMGTAIREAKAYAENINGGGLSCRIITGVTGSPDSTHYVETHCRTVDGWERVKLNGQYSTGFISQEQVQKLIDSGNASLSDYDVDDNLFSDKAAKVNQILHEGSINKRNRASVLACILLALANDPDVRVENDLTTLTSDLNARAQHQLEKYHKGKFYSEIAIHEPTSSDNHVRQHRALAKSIEMLRGLNITSAINSGRDMLGQFYEKFLTYANDAKEVGIVLTPRHITKFGAEVVDVSPTDIVFDPACGTGGFLVAALDRVREVLVDTTQFKTGNLHGIEIDPMIATLAIVNMIFRGDGSSNIIEGDSLSRDVRVTPTKVLMNPPFALEPPREEWRFVNHALDQMATGGLLFAILPTTTVGSANDGRGESTWRMRMLERHTLKASIKLPDDLFYPHVDKGTVGIIIQAGRPHKLENDVLWAVMDDGLVRKKTKPRPFPGIDKDDLAQQLGNFLRTGTSPKGIPQIIACRPIKDVSDLHPIAHLDSDTQDFDIGSVAGSLSDAHRLIRRQNSPSTIEGQWRSFPLTEFIADSQRGASGRSKNLPQGNLPLISTTERDNGISDMVERASVKRIYPPLYYNFC